jgi:hypothetical protein
LVHLIARKNKCLPKKDQNFEFHLKKEFRLISR